MAGADQHQIDTTTDACAPDGGLEPAAPSLRHVALLQAPRPIGVHVRPLTVPGARRPLGNDEQPNFYWAQEKFLRELQQGKACTGHLAPGADCRETIGGAMDLIPRSASCRDPARAGRAA